MALKLTLLSLCLCFYIFISPICTPFLLCLSWKLLIHSIVFLSLSLQDSGLGTPVTLRVDKQGFYLYWVDQNHEMDFLDIATIRDVRTGQYAKKPKVISFVLWWRYGCGNRESCRPPFCPLLWSHSDLADSLTRSRFSISQSSHKTFIYVIYDGRRAVVATVTHNLTTP
jgi:hypothetical protein